MPGKLHLMRILFFYGILLFTCFMPHVFGTEMSYPGVPLKNDPVEGGRSLFPGSLENPSFRDNAVAIDYVPGDGVSESETVDPDSVYAGLARTGTSENNKLTFKNGRVSRFVLGGLSLEGDVKRNSVVFSGGIAADAAIGKLCGGQTRNGDLEENVVTISGGRVVGDLYGGDADADGNAIGNRVVISGGELSGFVNGGGVSGIGIARKNSVTISGGTVGMGVSGGFAHFAADSPPEPTLEEKEGKQERTNSVLENRVIVSGKAEINGNVSGGFVLDSNGSADNNVVEISGGTIRGNVYGGRAFGGDAIGNTVVISGGTIKDRDEAVYGGYVHKPVGGRATGNIVTVSGVPRLETITIYGNNLPSWKTDGNTLNFKGFHGTVRGFSRFQHVNVDKDSRVTVTGEGTYEMVDLDNEGRIVLQNGNFKIHGKAKGNRPERAEK